MQWSGVWIYSASSVFFSPRFYIIVKELIYFLTIWGATWICKSNSYTEQYYYTDTFACQIIAEEHRYQIWTILNTKMTKRRALLSVNHHSSLRNFHLKIIRVISTLSHVRLIFGFSIIYVVDEVSPLSGLITALFNPRSLLKAFRNSLCLHA